jgi:mono/diheme cytochrome c family protein
MRTFAIVLTLFSLFFLIQCQNQNTEETSPNEELMAQGNNLLETNCYSCHSPEAGHQSRIAPPMAAIKKHYTKDTEGEQEFSEAIIAFMQNPSTETAKMKHAIEKFGLMPKMSLSEQELKAVSHYMYHAEIEKPGWNYKAEGKKYRKGKGKKSYLEKGKEIALSTKAVLGKNLLTAINAEGADHAVEFCNTRAIHLTDSMGQELNAKVKRVSDLNRNPGNVANEDELAYILETKEKLQTGLEPKPKLTDAGDRMIGYYPILTNEMCLKCHGKPKADINQATLDVIAALYPEDKAKGYGLNELRGIWVIEMDK